MVDDHARALFDALVEVAAERKKTADHEQRWLNLAGFLLRPGTGAPLDAWRARVMWGVFNENLAHPRSEPGKLAWWIAWRRIAGGLAKGQQDQIYDRLAQLLLPSRSRRRSSPRLQAEQAGARRDVARGRQPRAAARRQQGQARRRADAPAGAAQGPRGPGAPVGAVAARRARPALRPAQRRRARRRRSRDWLRRLLAWDWPEPDKAAFPLAQLGRRTGDRTRDLDDATRAQLAAAVRAMPGGDRAAVLVEQVVALEAREERVALGDTLPAGLKLVLDDAP